MIKEAYVSFEVAKLLKERGFDEYSFAYYTADKELNINRKALTNSAIDDGITYCEFSAPTQAMAMAWLRDEKNIFIDVCIPASGLKCYVYDIYYVDPIEETWDIILPDKKFSIGKKEEDYSTFEEAAEAGMLYVLKNLI